MPAVPQFSFSSTEFAGIGDFYDISVRVKGLEKRNSFFSLGEGLSRRINDKGNFLDLFDAVSASEDKRWESRGSKGRNNGEAALVLIHLDVPFTPDFGRRKHTSSTAHVTKGSLFDFKTFSSTFSKKKCTPGRSGEFLLLQHGGYVQRHDRYPRTQHLFGDQPFRWRSMLAFCSLRCSLLNKKG